jgi:hypothetical protein
MRQPIGETVRARRLGSAPSRPTPPKAGRSGAGSARVRGVNNNIG